MSRHVHFLLLIAFFLIFAFCLTITKAFPDYLNGLKHFLRWGYSQPQGLIGWLGWYQSDWGQDPPSQSAPHPRPIDCTSPLLNPNISYGTEGPPNEFEHLYKTLIACPNVRKLDLKIERGGCVIDNEENKTQSFSFQPRDRFPDLEELTPSGYHWDYRPMTWWNYHPPSNVESWRVALDWSRLKRLDLDIPPPSFIKAFHG